MKRLFATILLIFIISTTTIRAQQPLMVTFGPGIRWNFNNGYDGLSFNFEISFWKKAYPDAMSVDIGYEYKLNNKCSFIYTEFQVRFYYGGVSIGPVLGFSKIENKFMFGSQASIWIVPIAVIDFRFRRIGGESVKSTSFMLKYPAGDVNYLIRLQ